MYNLMTRSVGGGGGGFYLQQISHFLNIYIEKMNFNGVGPHFLEIMQIIEL